MANKKKQEAGKSSYFNFKSLLYTVCAEADEIRTFEQFHHSIRIALNKLNSGLPGKHFDMPDENDLQDCFQKWQQEDDPSEKKKIFVDFMMKKKNITFTEDDSTMITGLIIPPLAMAAKKAYTTSGFGRDKRSIVTAVPDVVFVPSATVIALVITKLATRLLLKP